MVNDVSTQSGGLSGRAKKYIYGERYFYTSSGGKSAVSDVIWGILLRGGFGWRNHRVIARAANREVRSFPLDRVHKDQGCRRGSPLGKTPIEHKAHLSFTQLTPARQSSFFIVDKVPVSFANRSTSTRNARRCQLEIPIPSSVFAVLLVTVALKITTKRDLVSPGRFLSSQACDLFTELNNDTVVYNAIDSGGGGLRVLENLVPLRKNQVGSNHYIATIVTFCANAPADPLYLDSTYGESSLVYAQGAEKLIP